MDPVYRFIALWRVATVAGAEALPKPTGALYNHDWILFMEDFMKKLGAKITLYPTFY